MMFLTEGLVFVHTLWEACYAFLGNYNTEKKRQPSKNWVNEPLEAALSKLAEVYLFEIIDVLVIKWPYLYVYMYVCVFMYVCMYICTYLFV